MGKPIFSITSIIDLYIRLSIEYGQAAAAHYAIIFTFILFIKKAHPSIGTLTHMLDI
jgi:hypothetical protein